MANYNNGIEAWVEKATNDMLTGPDWDSNIELCDSITMDPGQANDALRMLKKKLESENPKIQLLALFVLEALSKNCGDIVFPLIVEWEILHDMVKLVQKKPDLDVSNKILILIDTWQEALGGRGGGYSQYYEAYNELKSAGENFPPIEANSVLLFTPPETHSIVQPISSNEEVAFQTSFQTDTSGLSWSEIDYAQEIAEVLMGMLTALDPNNKMAIKEELIVDLVDQCRSYLNFVTTLVGSTTDEELLNRGLALNDTLMCVLHYHDDIAKGEARGPEIAIAPLVNVAHEDGAVDNDYSELPRSSRETLDTRNPKGNDEALRVSPLAPPPTSSTAPIPSASTVDSLSGDVYNSSGPSKATQRHVKFADQPSYDNEPTQLTTSTEFGSSYDVLVSQTRGISINTHSPEKNEKHEDL